MVEGSAFESVHRLGVIVVLEAVFVAVPGELDDGDVGTLLPSQSRLRFVI